MKASMHQAKTIPRSSFGARSRKKNLRFGQNPPLLSDLAISNPEAIQSSDKTSDKTGHRK